jgi:methylenetetrahydrofolate reductase (NADPH)
MLRVFQSELFDPDKFVVTLELVPGREAIGRAVDSVMAIAGDAFDDGRISAVSITDNPGGNPALSPDVLGSEIFKLGMDVIVHFACRDANRVGMESRALQLAMMGMKNILALTGDYSGKGFGGQGAPVFDIDSVQFLILLSILNERLTESGDPDEFCAGAAVSPFKYTEAESFAQYAKLCRKVSAGASFIITQLGYDSAKFAELIRIMRHLDVNIPVMGSVYVLTPAAARIMNSGKVPGAIVTDELLKQVEREWRNPSDGRRRAIERAAQSAAVLKGLGYQGVHIGGIHRSYALAARIMDRMAQYADQWEALVPELQFAPAGGYYAYPAGASSPKYGDRRHGPSFWEGLHYSMLQRSHDIFFNRDHALASPFQKLCAFFDDKPLKRAFTRTVEDPLKRMLLDCQRCGDCGIQHVAFLCPESGCPKHMRNGACGGSRNRRCEVFPDRDCIWVRAYARLARAGRIEEMIRDCVPPRMWELNRTSSWFNFHLRRDHQGVSSAIARRCHLLGCRL